MNSFCPGLKQLISNAMGSPASCFSCVPYLVHRLAGWALSSYPQKGACCLFAAAASSARCWTECPPLPGRRYFLVRWEAACRAGGHLFPGRGLSAQEDLQIWTLCAEPADSQAHGWRHQAAGRACCRLCLQVRISPEATCTSHDEDLPALALGKHNAIPLASTLPSLIESALPACCAASCAALASWDVRHRLLRRHSRLLQHARL